MPLVQCPSLADRAGLLVWFYYHVILWESLVQELVFSIKLKLYLLVSVLNVPCPECFGALPTLFALIFPQLQEAVFINPIKEWSVLPPQPGYRAHCLYCCPRDLHSSISGPHTEHHILMLDKGI